MPELRPIPIHIRICFDGYDLSNINDKKIFSSKKAIELELGKYLTMNNFTLESILFAYEEKKLRAIAVELYTDLAEYELCSRVSYEKIQSVVINELQDFIKTNFHENQRRSSIRIYSLKDLPITSNNKDQTNKISETDDDDYIIKTSARFAPIDPFYTFDHLVINKDTLDNIEIALAVLEHSEMVFNQWGLKKIEPFPRAVLNFYGPPGTGKTLAAHAIANKLGKKLIIVGCPEIQSKYHGEGPKNVKAVFYAAEKSDSILFFDEADSLLSKRLEEVNTGAEDEINNMRNAMLTCLEMHKGIVIFASNFVKRYDYAFETRVQSVLFPLPDLESLEKIWAKHFLPTIPTAGYIDLHKIAEKTLGFCGRDVKNAVIKSCFTAVHKGKASLCESDILEACNKIVSSREDIKKADYSQGDPVKEENIPKSLEAIINSKAEDWRKRYLSDIPVAGEIDIHRMVETTFAFNDHEIRNAIMLGCLSAARKKSDYVTEQDLMEGFRKVKKSRTSSDKEDDIMLSDEDDPILETLQKIVDRQTDK